MDRRRFLGAATAAFLAGGGQAITTETEDTSLMADDLIDSGSDITEQQLRKLLGRTGISHYVEVGLNFNPNWSDNILNVSPGRAYLLDAHRDYPLEFDGTIDVALSAGTVNDIYAYYDTDAAAGERTKITAVAGSDNPPGYPSLQIGVADDANQTTTELNRASPAESPFEDIDGDGVLETPQNSGIETPSITGVADRIVASTSGLESAFDNLSAGETLLVAQPETPYRTSQWLDIDVDGVTVVGQSQFAENGEPLIKVADGGHVGGVRVGYHSNTPVNDARIVGVGFDGNHPGQDDTKRLHGFYLYNATRSTVARCHATRLSPYHVHAIGGSGITVGYRSSHITLRDNWIDDTGDRGIQCAGEDLLITGNHCSNGYDRSIALDTLDETGTDQGVSRTVVANNVGHDNPEGSIIGFANGGAYNHTDITITGNVGYGNHRSVITAFTQQADEKWTNIRITNNTVRGQEGTQDVEGIRIGRGNEGDFNGVLIANNSVQSTDRAGIEIADNVHGATITGNILRRAGGGGDRFPHPGIHIKGVNVAFNRAVVTSNLVKNPGGDGIFIDDAGACVVGLNNVHNPGGVAINDAGNGNIYIGNMIDGGFAGTAGPESQKLGNMVR